ncbi:Low molecular weight protein tyrosine phosphatase [Enhygromyxa salina]|uniref:protein-tyrosine-phosphatase n=1 Tax=Enhygromyxa salina TaxID=215803 RepID=A0A0C2CV27_9BACT|nr:low molecular weight protein-tyrosine-phosphatase [Enhygromyxa salina]KIG11712.1 Low molecular weight protein tyrosine phosphatase [Enhygromyxa salina]
MPTPANHPVPGLVGPFKLSVCFVCLGNICRSPTAEGVLTKLVADAGLRGRIRVDSVGTGAWHKGERADKRARTEAQRRGYDLQSVARQITSADFTTHDLLIGMDHANLRELEALAAKTTSTAKFSLLRSYDPLAPADSEVPDPYYGGLEEFARMFDMVEAACRGLLARLRSEHGL